MTRSFDNLAGALGRCLTLVAIAASAGPAAWAQQGTLYVVEDKVGVGTESPVASLEVQGNSGATQILIDENSGTRLVRNLLILDNQGPPRMLFRDSGTNKSWLVGAYFGNFFRLDTPSGAGTEFQIDQGGNVTISGTLNQSSSRALKQNFSVVDPRVILDRVAEMPITSWSYINDETGALHIGPVAEDFRATFELGQDDKHIAPSDTAGVALAAIKGLNIAAQTDRAEVAELRQENSQLQARIEAMAAAQEELTRRLEALEVGSNRD